MSDKLRARARELAEEIANPFLMTKAVVTVEAINSAILAGMREALMEEPDEAMASIGWALMTENKIKMADIPAKCFRVLAEARARGLE